MLSVPSMILVGALSVSGPGNAAHSDRSCGQNAALGYWMAFAQMDNPDASKDIAARLERTARGTDPWDEILAPTVDHNREALATMQRSALRPFCDWGIEYALHAETPIAHIVRANALSRLNVVYGKQLVSQGKAGDAVEAWLAGLRFSRDVAIGAPLLGAMAAANGVQLHLRAIERAVAVDSTGAGRQLSAEQVRRVEQVVGSLREDAFDWGSTADVELESVMGMLQALATSEEPSSMLQRLVGGNGDPRERERSAAEFLGLRPEQLTDRETVRRALRQAHAAAGTIRPQLVAALRLPQPQSIQAVRDLDARVKAEPTLAQSWPSFARTNEELRAGAIKARADLLAALRRR